MILNRPVLFCIFAAFGGFVFGYDIGYIAGCLIMDPFVQTFGEQDQAGIWFLSSQRKALITALLSVGTFFGSILQSFLSDRIGRKGSLIFWGGVFTVGVVLQTASLGFPQLLAGRCVAGFGVGALSAVVPLYVGESAPKRLRGACLVLYQVQNMLGLFIAYAVSLGTHHYTSDASWRIPVGLQLAWGIGFTLGAIFLPESPRYLLNKDRTPEAIHAIARLNDCSPDDKLVGEYVSELEEAIRLENDGGKASWLELASLRGHMWRRTLNAMMVQFLQQLNGQNYYFYYGPVLFENARAGLNPWAIQTIFGAVSLVMVIPSIWTIENVGRRKSLLFGAALQAVFAAIAGLSGYFLSDREGVSEASKITGGKLLVAFSILHISAFSATWGPTPWVVCGETFPIRVRAKGIALGTATNWFWNFMLSYFAPLITDDIGSLILMVFCGALVFAFFYVFLLLPETKGLSLEEIDALYRSGVPAWRAKSNVLSERHAADAFEDASSRERAPKRGHEHVEMSAPKPVDQHSTVELA